MQGTVFIIALCHFVLKGKVVAFGHYSYIFIPLICSIFMFCIVFEYLKLLFRCKSKPKSSSGTCNG